MKLESYSDSRSRSDKEKNYKFCSINFQKSLYGQKKKNKTLILEIPSCFGLNGNMIINHQNTNYQLLGSNCVSNMISNTLKYILLYSVSSERSTSNS